jgi:uncharacterized protein YndB with AHSA1/START domain
MRAPADAPEIRSVVIEREMPFPASRIWRALTQPHLIAEWLLKGDFKPVVGHDFQFTQDWGSIDCRVTEVEPETSLAYTWAAFGLESTVTWTLTPTGQGTRLRMEQVGFRRDQEEAYRGARAAWTGYFKQLEAVVGRHA